jgi:lipoprotein NlpI
VQLYTLRGELRQYARPLESALDDLNKAVALDPHFYDALRSRGAVLTKLGRYGEALKDLNEAVALAPNFSDGYFWRANAEIRMRKTNAAREDCQYALTLAPRHTPCILIGLRASFMLGDFGPAAEFAKQLQPEFFSSAPLYHGVAILGSGQTETAAAELHAYAAAEPNDPYGWLWLYLVDRRLGKEGPAAIKDLSVRRDAWPTPIFRYIAGAATADEVLAAADVPDPDIRNQRIAEANFYLGELAALAGDDEKSFAYKKAALAIGYAEIDPLDHIPVYDDNNALELGMAMARPGGEL